MGSCREYVTQDGSGEGAHSLDNAALTTAHRDAESRAPSALRLDIHGSNRYGIQLRSLPVRATGQRVSLVDVGVERDV
jgi:hypothetical protein